MNWVNANIDLKRMRLIKALKGATVCPYTVRLLTALRETVVCVLQVVDVCWQAFLIPLYELRGWHVCWTELHSSWNPKSDLKPCWLSF